MSLKLCVIFLLIILYAGAGWFLEESKIIKKPRTWGIYGFIWGTVVQVVIAAIN